MFTWKIRIVIFRCAVHTSCVCVTVSYGSITQQRTRYCACSQQLEVCKNYCLTVETAFLLILVFSLVIHDIKTIWRTIPESTIKKCATLSSAGRIQLLDLRHKSQCTNHVVVVVVEVCNRKAISKHCKYRILFFKSSHQKS